MKNTEYTLSIAIVTRNRSESLSVTLQSLSKQSIKPFEIIISDDSNSENEIRATKNLAGQYNCQYISGPQKGLYANRNFVARHCRGTHFRTMDDDHQFPEQHLEACMQAIEDEPQTIWTIGEYFLSDKIHKKPYPMPGQLHPRGFAVKPGDMSGYFGISCGATIYPRSVIDRNILNSELYKFGVTYLEYGARLKYMGYVLKVLPTTYIIHDNSDTNASRLSNDVIDEARVFSILNLSFRYQKNFKNKILTFLELLKLVIINPKNIAVIKRAYANLKATRLAN